MEPLGEGCGGGQGASVFHTTSLELDIPFICCTEEVGYQRRPAALLADWRRDENVPTGLDVAYTCLDEN